jgi:hypothetical protein
LVILDHFLGYFPVLLVFETHLPVPEIARLKMSRDFETHLPVPEIARLKMSRDFETHLPVPEIARLKMSRDLPGIFRGISWERTFAGIFKDLLGLALHLTSHFVALAWDWHFLGSDLCWDVSLVGVTDI